MFHSFYCSKIFWLTKLPEVTIIRCLESLVKYLKFLSKIFFLLNDPLWHVVSDCYKFISQSLSLKCSLLMFSLIQSLDFGDTSCSYYVFELAIAMAYMMIESKELSTGGLVIAGYGMIRNIPEHERKVLKVCTCIQSQRKFISTTYC